MADTTLGRAQMDNSAVPDHLKTAIERGDFNEKAGTTTTTKQVEDEEDDEDMDALIDGLESEDGHAEEEQAEEEAGPTTGRIVPEDMLQTDTRTGLSSTEVAARRKKYGMNQMKEEKENMVLKFLWYFVGPIQFVMEVCLWRPFPCSTRCSRHLALQRSPGRSIPSYQTMPILPHSRIKPTRSQTSSVCSPWL